MSALRNPHELLTSEIRVAPAIKGGCLDLKA